MSSRYWTIRKDQAANNIRTSINNLIDLLSQETESVILTDSVEVEVPNMVSGPPHYIRLVHTIKLLNALEQSVQNNDFLSFPTDEG